MRHGRAFLVCSLVLALTAWVAPSATAAAQTVTTLPATDITDTSFTAHCSVTTSIRTQVLVKYGKVGTTQLKSAVTYIFTSTSDVPIALSSLTPRTDYYVQCKTYNSTYGTVAGAKITVRTTGDGTEPPPPPPPPPPGDGTTIVAVGDMCEPNPVTSCNGTGNIASSINPTLYALLGDTQYENGTTAEYASGYAKSSWNALKGISYPTIGNHEIQSGSDAAYCSFFPLAHCVGSARWYAYDIDANWRAVVLDSNRPSNTAQLAWLDAELANDRSRNLLVMWHHPRWRNSGTSGHTQASVGVLMTRAYNAHADIVLWGHDHIYTRWAKLGPSGPAANGFRAFTVGTGGADLVGAVTSNPFPGTEMNLRQFGVLELNLDATSYSWRFRTTSGSIADSGSDTVTP